MNLDIFIEKSKIIKFADIILIAIVIITVLNLCRLCIFGKTLRTHKLENANKTENHEKEVSEIDDDYKPALECKSHILYKGATVTLPGGAKQFNELMQNRRSVRAFKSHPVPSIGVIKTCILAAGAAPSGAHTEPWTFCIVRNNNLKRRIRELLEFEEALNYSQRMNRQWKADLRPLKTNHIKPYLTNSPYLIAVFKQVYGYTKEGQRKQHYYNEISVSIAIGFLLCALQASGLSTVITTPLNCGSLLRNLLDRPSNEKLVALLPIGYAADDCKVPDLSRKSLKEIMVLY